MKSFQIITITILSFLLINCGEKKKVATDKNNQSRVSVKIAKAALISNNPFISVSGKVQALENATLSTRIMGYVDKIYVNIGDHVNKDQLLLSINSSDLHAKEAQAQASIIKAEAGFKNAEKDYNRFKELFKQNSATQKEMDDMSAHYEMAKASLQAAKQMREEINVQFKYTNIKAPFSGVITSKFINEGTLANPGMPLVSLEGKNGFEVVAMVPENEISTIKKGRQVTVLVNSVNKKISGKVTEISSSAKNTGGQYLVTVHLENSPTKILSGMFATVRFPTEQSNASSTGILIPSKAIVKRGQLHGVYTVSQRSKALLRWLRLGRSFGDQVEVLSGLSVDENYIIEAEGKLYNGVEILIQ